MDSSQTNTNIVGKSLETVPMQKLELESLDSVQGGWFWNAYNEITKTSRSIAASAISFTKREVTEAYKDPIGYAEDTAVAAGGYIGDVVDNIDKQPSNILD